MLVGAFEGLEGTTPGFRWNASHAIPGMVAQTGFLFFAGAPGQDTHNAAFGYKLLFIAVAGVNVGLFYVTGLSRRVDRLGSGEDAPLAAKLVVARMLPFIGDAF